MAYPDYLGELMKELGAVEFLKVTLKKLEEINIKTEEEILLLDKVLYKASSISKDYKMRLLTPQLQEKFNQRMEDMKLDQSNFLNMLKPYEQVNGPYTRPKGDISLNLAPTPNNPTPDNSQAAFNIVPESNPEPLTALPSSDKNYRSYGNPRRPVEQGGMTPKRTRSNSSSSSSSSSGSEERRSSSGKLQDKTSRFSAKDTVNEKSSRLPAKYSFPLKKPETSRVVRAHGLDKEDYFERSSRAYEPRSERGEGSGRERDFRRSPEPYYPERSNKPYRTKKIYKPPPAYKH